jgi:hypothetical protein
VDFFPYDYFFDYPPILVNDQRGVGLKRCFPRLFRGSAQCSSDSRKILVDNDFFASPHYFFPPASIKKGVSPELS